MMTASNFGLYFKKLAVLGKDKKPAEITFSKGLNVISGASDTGKSYIVECMDYILAGKDSPKPINESTGYEKIQAELGTFDGKSVTLSRQFDDHTIYMAECSFQEFKNEEATKLSVNHSDNNDNLSAYLLSLLQLQGKQLKTKSWDKKSLSFRDLARFCIIKETKIFDVTSPIYDEVTTNKTRNESLFNLLLTGKDATDFQKSENPKLGKARINGKIELVTADINSKTKLLAELNKRTEALTTEQINVQIQKLVSLIAEAHKELKEQEEKRQLLWEELDRIKGHVVQNQAIKKRFDLLDDVYSSDLRRLEFINEGSFGIDQLKEVNCPLCDSLINKKLLEPYSERDESFLVSVKTEYDKIQLKQKELREAIKEKSLTIDSIEQALVKKQAEYDAVDKLISDKLRPIKDIHSEELDGFMKLNKDKAQATLLESQIAELNVSLENLVSLSKEKQKKPPEKVMPENVHSLLSDEIKSFLSSWGVDYTVCFDPTKNDIKVNNEERRSSGKGYRALYLSAFMFGVLQFCVKKELKHPRFLVLDTPLRAYKEEDNDEKEKLPTNLQYRFYESLANLPYINQVQVVIIENIDPPPSILNTINYVHFTKNIRIPRYGFYPI